MMAASAELTSVELAAERSSRRLDLLLRSPVYLSRPMANEESPPPPPPGLACHKQTPISSVDFQYSPRHVAASSFLRFLTNM